MNRSAIAGVLTANKRYYLVIVSMLPLVIWSCFIYGAKPWRLTLAALGTCVLLHVISCVLFKYILKKERFIWDLSPLVSALLLVLSLPVTVSYPALLAGCAVAIVSKELFGGLGKNPLNPALAGRVFIELVFNSRLAVNPIFDTSVDASPIQSVLANGIPDTSPLYLFLGRADGNLGQMSALLLIIAFIFLFVNKVISWQTPLAMIVSAGVLTMFIAPENVSYIQYTAGHLLTGGLIFAAVYFACDPVTTPHTSTGRLIFGAAAGALSVACRIYLGYEGMYLILLLLGLWSPFIDRMLRPGVFGGIKVQRKNQTDGKASQ